MSEKAALIEPHIPALRRYAFALIREDSAADDLVQDCLERAVARWHLRRGDGDVRAWLFSILHNRFVSQRRETLRRGRHGPLEEAEETAGVPGAQEPAMVHRDLLRAMAALPEEQQAVLLLVGVEDLSYAEAAKAIGVPVGTVMSRLSRARDRLRRLMNGERPALLRRVK
ncbi:sigma-70 family RNA polymerase sigma factor [Azospirillum sp. SYSU D00513]|uniref:sigma-70 family RNA polymerase sigma factor n=1 Tax=Azospirillum sp. SYSU D00513 TaxID=2812561 RepID=UPI001A9775A3|nr:sigma-70 family RNA polymerase sigma factor [Azospirillum sp. SYSU D00513]